MARALRLGSRTWRTDNTGRAEGERTEHRFGEDVVLTWRWGTGTRPTLVLVHGIGMGQQYFGLLRRELFRRVDVVAINLPGFGDSPAPSEPMSMERCGVLVGLALDELGLTRVDLVGHSMGTQVVAELAAARPDLVHRLVLIAPTVDARARRARTQVLRLLRDLLNDPPIVGLVGLTMYAHTGPRWFITQFHSMMRHRIEAVAPRIQVPTLVIRGDEDRVCPRGWVRHVTDLIPDAEMVEAEGKGHEAMITGAEPVADLIIEFIADPADAG